MNDLDILAHNWGAVAIRGVAAVALGLIALIVPGFSLMALVFTFSAYAFVDGIFSLVSAVRGGSPTAPWWVLMLRGIAGIGISVATIMWPGVTTVALVYLIACWAVVSGILEISAAIRLRKSISGEWLLALSGLLTAALGVALFAFPGIGALALVLWVGIYALASGLVLIGLSLKLKHWWSDHLPSYGRMAHP
jgi:uncharacterized membrane protein HdeD (DUF308 family)